MFGNNNSSFSNIINDNKIITPNKFGENNSNNLKNNKIKEDQSNIMTNKSIFLPNNKPNMNNNLMNNFLLKSKEQEKIVANNNNSTVKNTIGTGGINFNNNIN